MINPTNQVIDEYTTFKMYDKDHKPYMLDEDTVEEFDLFNLVVRAYDYTQRRGLPYADVTLHDLQNTFKKLGNATPQELAEWVEAVLDVTLEIFDN